jgi:acetyl esterase
MNRTAGAVDVHVEDIEYLNHPSGALLARIYRPKRNALCPAVVSVHGGIWVRETRLTNALIDEAVAAAGAVVMAVDFRMPPIAKYPASIEDINFATRWLKLHARDLGSRPELVGGIGTSSGGHQLMLSAMRPHDPRYCALSLPGDGDNDASLAFAVIGWPVVDPLARYKMAIANNMTTHIAAHDAYWPDQEAMSEGNPQLILERGEQATLPPTLLIQGTADNVLPADMADRFARTFRKSGGVLELRKYAGQSHTFITKQGGSVDSLHAIDLISAFIRYRGMLLA